MRKILQADNSLAPGLFAHQTEDERFDIGDSSFNWNLNYTSSKTQHYTAGVVMRLKHSVHGIVEALYCYFPEGIKDEQIGRPVFQMKGRTSYVCSFEETGNLIFLGLSMCTQATNESCWAWVLIRGVNPISLELDLSVISVHSELFVTAQYGPIKILSEGIANLRRMFVVNLTETALIGPYLTAHPGSIYIS